MWKKRLLKIFLVIVVLVVGYMLVVSNFHYSEGTRTGYLSKFSKKGFVFKTHEGELFVGGANADNHSIVNNTWYFSVRSGEGQVIDSLEHYEGHVVRLHYYQVIKNMPWQGDTEYFVDGVDFLRDN